MVGEFFDPVKGPKSATSALDRMSRASGAKEKAVLLKRYDSKLLRKILVYALDPYKRFGVAKLKPELGIGEVDDPDAKWSAKEIFWALNQLAKRKVTGNKALQLVNQAVEFAPAWADIFEKILKKDLRCGIQAKTVNETFPDLIPNFQVMKAEDFPDYEAKLKYPVFGEVKYDGIRITAVVCDGQVIDFTTRKGLYYNNYATIKAELAEASRLLSGTHVIDGELMVKLFCGKGGRKKAEENAGFVIFDILPIEQWANTNLCEPFQVRRKNLETWMGCIKFIAPHLMLSQGKLLNSKKELKAYYKENMDAGEEGIMVKVLYGKYTRKRSPLWLKMKLVFTVDCKVVATYEGEVGKKLEGMLGGLTVEFWGKDGEFKKPVLVDVGGGFKHVERYKLWKQRDKLIGRMCEVKANWVTPDGKMRHGNFKRWRDDK